MQAVSPALLMIFYDRIFNLTIQLLYDFRVWMAILAQKPSRIYIKNRNNSVVDLQISFKFAEKRTNLKICKQSTIKHFYVDSCIIDKIFKNIELVKFITTALKSVLNLVKLESLVAKCCKMQKIQACKVCKFCILLYYARKTKFRTLFNAVVMNFTIPIFLKNLAIMQSVHYTVSL